MMKKSLSTILYILVGVSFLGIINNALSTPSNPLNNFLLFTGIGLIYALSAEIINQLLDRFYPWSNHPNRIYLNMVVYFLVMGGLSIVISFGVNRYFSTTPITLQAYLQDSRGILSVLIYFFISILFTFFFHAKGFYEKLVQSKLEEKELIEQRNIAEIQVLNQQIEPHFLFNNLAVLHSLIDSDPKKAQKYVENLTQYYREVLQSRNQDKNNLQDELAKAKNYFKLMQIRFGDTVMLDIEESLNDLTNEVIPLSIQMGIENAIKHNSATAAKPLVIKIYQEPDYLVIENSLQPKKVMQTSQLGLDNLTKRYALYDKELLVEKQPSSFQLKLPLL